MTERAVSAGVATIIVGGVGGILWLAGALLSAAEGDLVSADERSRQGSIVLIGLGLLCLGGAVAVFAMGRPSVLAGRGLRLGEVILWAGTGLAVAGVALAYFEPGDEAAPLSAWFYIGGLVVVAAGHTVLGVVLLRREVPALLPLWPLAAALLVVFSLAFPYEAARRIGLALVGMAWALFAAHAGMWLRSRPDAAAARPA